MVEMKELHLLWHVNRMDHNGLNQKIPKSRGWENTGV